MPVVRGTSGYKGVAEKLLNTILCFDEVHQPYLHLIPKLPANILDIGAGPGHDAAHFAKLGHRVVACEPLADLRTGAMARYGHFDIQWLDDDLPDLKRLRTLNQRFDFILLSGVWMHLNGAERKQAFPLLAKLLSPSGVLAMSLRHGAVPKGRCMYAVSAAETIKLADSEGLSPVVNVERQSIQAVNRANNVTWSILAFSGGV